jgi:hypothetical protein
MHAAVFLRRCLRDIMQSSPHSLGLSPGKDSKFLLLSEEVSTPFDTLLEAVTPLSSSPVTSEAPALPLARLAEWIASSRVRAVQGPTIPVIALPTIYPVAV